MSICVGCGLEVVDGILQVDVDGTTVTCGASGLTATATSFPGISTDACNGSKLGTDGKVWSPCPEGITGINNSASPNIGDIPLTMVTAGVYNFESVAVAITNTSACCTVSGMVSFMSGFQGSIEAQSLLTAQMAVKEDAGAFINSSPASYEIFHNLHATDSMAWSSNLYDQIHSSWAPGATHTWTARTRFTQTNGDGDVTAGGFFELQWNLVPTSCGC
jgi:hypothetical protein